jgi:hypothetical protein
LALIGRPIRELQLEPVEGPLAAPAPADVPAEAEAELELEDAETVTA